MGLASPQTCDLVNAAGVAVSAGETEILPLERQPPIAFVVGTFG
jgi:hypothetical protein